MTLITKKDTTVPVTVQTRTDLPPDRAFDAAVDLSLVFKGWGPFPAVLGIRNQTGPWDHAGASRNPMLSDGSTATEKLTEYMPGHSFAYELTGFTNTVLRGLVYCVRGEWTYTPDGSGTVIRWTYEFKPLRRRGWLVRHVLAPLWRHYMQASVEAAAHVVEDRQHRKAYIITGPTPGIGRATAFEVAQRGIVVLVGRDRDKLDAVQKAIQQKGGQAASVVCDLSDVASVRRAAAEILSLDLPLTGLVNNAGIMQLRPSRSAQGWDMSYATNHLGPFVLTEALLPHLPDGANIVFVVSGAEDPARKPAKVAGFRGGRYISAEASAHGQWKPGGSKNTGFDAYATSKQSELAAALEFARETPRLHFNAVEPGFSPGTGLGRDVNAFLRFLAKYLLQPLAPHIKYWSSPELAAHVISKALMNEAGKTGVYYDEKGQPMQASTLVRDPKFTARVVAETRALLATVPG